MCEFYLTTFVTALPSSLMIVSFCHPKNAPFDQDSQAITGDDFELEKLVLFFYSFPTCKDHIVWVYAFRYGRRKAIETEVRDEIKYIILRLS